MITIHNNAFVSTENKWTLKVKEWNVYLQRKSVIVKTEDK